MIATCPVCGAEYDRGGARFCGGCGARLEEADPGRERTPARLGSRPDEVGARRRPRSGLAAGAAVTVLLGAVLVVLLSGGNGQGDRPPAAGGEAGVVGPDPAENPDGTVPDAADHAGEVEDYLAALAPLVDEELTRLDELAEILDGTYATRENWLEAIAETAETFRPGAELAERAAEIDPPAGYEVAHDTFVASLERRPPHGEAVVAAAARDDVLNLALAVQRFNLDLAEVLIAAPPPMCHELIELAKRFLDHRDEFCRDPATLPHGDYGRQVWSITRRLTIEVFARTAAPPPSHLIRDEEVLAWNVLVLPDVRREVADARARAGSLRPPSELRDDHRALLTFLDGLGEVYDATIAAAAAGERRSRAEGDRLARVFEHELSPAGRELFILLLLK